MQKQLRNIFLILSYTMFINTLVYAQENEQIQKRETDSIIKDSLSPKKSFFNSGAVYKAIDTVSIEPNKKIITLYNNAMLEYDDMTINSGKIVIDYLQNEIYAGRIKDSAGVYTQSPVFKQGSDVIEPDSIRFNLDTKKALIFNSKTEQSGMNIISEKTKKENDSVYFMDRAKFTTSVDLENPEYYFLLRNAKVVPGKKLLQVLQICT